MFDNLHIQGGPCGGAIARKLGALWAKNGWCGSIKDDDETFYLFVLSLLLGVNFVPVLFTEEFLWVLLSQFC